MAANLLAIYGINNIGKSTQIQCLIKKFKKTGKKAIAIKYPIYDLEPSGPFLDRILRSGKQKITEAELQLWFVLNRFQFQKNLQEKLKQNDIVILEDYIGTGIAWGLTKGLDQKWLNTINQPLITPDIVILLDGKQELSAREIGHIHEKNSALIARCRQIYLKLASRYHWKTIKVQKHPDQTAALIWQFLQKSAMFDL